MTVDACGRLVSEILEYNACHNVEQATHYKDRISEGLLSNCLCNKFELSFEEKQK